MAYQWLTFELLGITYLVGKIKFKPLFHGPKWLSKKPFPAAPEISLPRHADTVTSATATVFYDGTVVTEGDMEHRHSEREMKRKPCYSSRKW